MVHCKMFSSIPRFDRDASGILAVGRSRMSPDIAKYYVPWRLHHPQWRTLALGDRELLKGSLMVLFTSVSPEPGRLLAHRCCSVVGFVKLMGE